MAPHIDRAAISVRCFHWKLFIDHLRADLPGAIMRIVKLIIQTALVFWLLTFVVTITSTLTPPTLLWAMLLLSVIVLLIARSAVDRTILASRRAGAVAERSVGENQRQMEMDT
jgi:hypothetical protein